MPTISLKSLKNKLYKIYAFIGAWKDSFGQPEHGSRWLVYGHSGEGKTDFVVQLIKYMSQFGKCLFFSKEQSNKNSIWKCFDRHDLWDNKKVSLIYDENFNYLIEKLNKRNYYKIVVIDSIDYLKMTEEHYKILDSYKDKTFIFVSWQEGKKPKSSAGKAIEYMVDVKIQVDGYVAKPRGRYEGNLPFVIWEEGAKRSKKHAFLNI
jgi:predicted ATP-dependent serine protease